MKLMLIPQYERPDKGDGGIRRVVEAQKKYLPEYGFEIVGNIADADILATHAAETPDVPVEMPWIVHCHGLYWSDYDWPGWGPRVNAAVIEAMKRCDHVTAPSEWVAYALKRGMWLNPTVLNHGIDPELWEPGENKGYVLWNKARTDAISDPSPINKLAVMCPDIQFVSTFGQATKNVFITGKKIFSEAQKDIRHAGVYLATARETFGIGTLEAMACGVPILGWNWGGQAEFIQHGITGWLSPIGDYEDLQKGLYWCIENRNKIGNLCREDALNRFTWKKVMESYAKLYEQIYKRQMEFIESPKVSLIVPNHNLGHLLPLMLDSVNKQTMANWEMIIVDDSTDNTSYQVAKDIAKSDDRIKLVHSKTNLLLTGSLNYGFKWAKGRYVMNMDPDNLLPPTTLKILSDALDNDRSIHIVYGRIKFVLEDGETPDPITGTEDGISRWPPEFNCIHQFMHRNQIPCNALMRREVRERTGGYRLRAKVSEDAEFWTRAVSYGFNAKKVTENVTLIYRYRAESKSRGESEPDWTSWMPWTRDYRIAPWGVAARPPADIGKCWPVPSCQPALVTIIIPVGIEHTETVIDALDSVEAQKFRNWHCIVVNDSGKKLHIPHIWAEVINTEGSKGPAVSRNLGMAKAKTEAIVYLDADDILQPDCLDLMWRLWKENKGVVYSQWWDDKGGNDITVWNPPEWEPQLLITHGCIHATCAMYEYKIWSDVGGFDSTMQNWEDWDFQLAYALKGYCAYKINKPLFTYRKTTGSRREDAAANKARGEIEMKRKWPDMWNGQGKEKLMGCCGGRKKSVTPPKVIIPKLNTGNGMSLLEYIGPSAKSMWIGKSTGRKYYFGSDQSHRKMFVFNDDIPGFVSIKNMFRIIPLERKSEEIDKPLLAGEMVG